MSWQLLPQDTRQQDTLAPHRISFAYYDNDLVIKTLNLSSSTPIQYAENDDSIACVIGRLRPYNQDYLPGNAAEWFLSLANTSPVNYYPALAGFFVLILISKQGGTVQVVNDHVGSIPFYLDTRSADHWYFSDNLQTLKAQSGTAQIAPQALYNYLYFHCIPAPTSVYQHINKLMPGSVSFVRLTDAVKTETLYNPEFSHSTLTDQQLTEQCQQVISEAVRRNVTDNCAAFLSGGLDSSTVAGMLARHSTTAKTYSIGFDAKGYDETEYALITAKHFNTEHKVHYLQPEEISQHFTHVAGHFTEPFGNSSAMAAFICASKAKQDGIKVLLAGDGGDEIFAGNERYVKQKVFERFYTLPKPLQRSLRLMFDNALAAAIPGIQKASSYVRQASVQLPARLDSYNFLNRFDINRIFSTRLLKQVDPLAPADAKKQRYDECRSAHAVDKMMYLDWKFTLADNDLVKVNSMCQLAGVEVRYPLFEKEVVDFSCTVPAETKAPGQQLRDFYKRSFSNFLPAATINKSKHGFGLPFGVWMKQQSSLQQITKQALDSLNQRNIIEAKFIEHALDTYQQGHAGYYGELVWIMVTLELWLAQHEATYVA